MKMRNIAAAFLTAVIALGAASCGSINVSPSTSEVVEKTVDIGETDSLDISLNVSKLTVKLGDKNQVHYRVCKEIEPKVSENGGVLSVKVDEGVRINFSGSDDDNYIEITLTKKKLEDIDVRLSSGSAFFDGLDIDGRVKASSGSIGVKNVTDGGDIDLSASSGSIGLTDCKFKTVREETSSGSAYAENVTAQRIDLLASSGSISAELTQLCNTNIKTSSGSIYVKLTCGENDSNFDLSVSSGDIRFNGEDHDRKYRKDNGKDVTVKCEASSGDIEVTLV